uniref:Neuromedin U receptor 1 n=1 Tax=Rhinopithecus bieti TaxID=61621 RepID=A0A2K6KE67_RHIBE
QTPPCLNCSVLPGDLYPGDARSPMACNGSAARGHFDPEDLNLTDDALRLKYLGPLSCRQSCSWVPAVPCTPADLPQWGRCGQWADLSGHPCAQGHAHRPPTTTSSAWPCRTCLVLAGGCPWSSMRCGSTTPSCWVLVCLQRHCPEAVERYVAWCTHSRPRSMVTQASVRRVLGAVWGPCHPLLLPRHQPAWRQQLYVPAGPVGPDSDLCTLSAHRALYNLAVADHCAASSSACPGYHQRALPAHVGCDCGGTRLLTLQAPAARDRGRRQVTRCFVLVVVFGICWAPFHADRVMWSIVSQWTDSLHLAFQHVHVISGIFFYLGSAANPVLYSLMSSRFRETFQEALCLGAHCHRLRPRHSSHSLSRVTTGSTLCDVGSPGSRVHPLARDDGPEEQQETDPS